MISIRPFAQTDNEALLKVEKLCPQGDSKCAWGVAKKGDISARYKMYDNWKMSVAEDDGKIAGWIGWTIKEDPRRDNRYAYIAEVMVHPNSRRKGVASKLVSEAESDVKDRGADHVYCFLYESNHASKSLFQNLGYAEKALLWNCALMVHKKSRISHKYSIENPGRDDLQEVAQLINNYNKSKAHFSPFTAESFEEYVSNIPAYGLDNFWVVRHGDVIVACAGIWDCTYFGDLYYAREPATMRFMGRIVSVLGHLINLPKFPKEGEFINLRMMTSYSVDSAYPDAMQDLIAFLNNKLLEVRANCLLHVVSPPDKSFEVARKMKPQIEKWSVYAKALSSSLEDLSPFYVDVRDLIL